MAIRVTASSVQGSNEAFQASCALDADKSTRWSSDFSDPQWLQIDLGAAVDLSGVELYWENAYAKAYQVLTSMDGTDWSTAYETSAGDGGTDEVVFQKQAARFVKIVGSRRGSEFGYSLFEVVLKGADGRPVPGAFVPSLRKVYELAARQAPGCYPRWLSNQQAFWTILGVPDDEKESLFCEDGTIEHHKRGYTLMPLVYADGKLISRDDAAVSQSLENNCLPIPSVHWRADGVDLDITAFAYGDAGQSSVYARYRLTNRGRATQTARLFLLLRPFQLYPPWQGEGEGENEEEGKGLGGLAKIGSIRRTALGLTVNGKYLMLVTPPDGFGTTVGAPALEPPYRDALMDDLRKGVLPAGGDVEDPDRQASAVLAYNAVLEPGDARDVHVALPLHKAMPVLNAVLPPAAARERFETLRWGTARLWEEKIRAPEFVIPEPGVVDTLKANLAYSFITKDGPALQPGSWCYDKAWIRDGSVAAVAFLQLGFTNEARAFLDWYTGYQYESGEIPCVIDNKAKNPFWENISEYDSQGEYVRAVWEVYRFTRDRAWLQGKLTNVVRALQFAEELRGRRLTPEYQENPDKKLLYGLISKSYANHNYSDNLWTLCGWRDGAKIARALGREDLAGWMDAQYHVLQASVLSSIDGAMRKHGIDFIPEYPEGANFWPASIAFGVACCRETASLPAAALQRTFDKAYARVQAWRNPQKEYRFTPEEMPTGEAFLYLNQKGRALEFLRLMLAHRKPIGWKQWPEVVNSEERLPTIFGDMPHTWVSAQYINFLRALFVYEEGDSLVLGAGVDPRWLAEGTPCRVLNLPTHFGRISLDWAKRDDGAVTVRVSGDAAPPEGFAVRSPLDNPVRGAAVNGASADLASDGTVRFSRLPAEVVFSYGEP